MSLIKAWSPYFQTETRDRGRAYQSEGRVQQLQPEAGEMIRASVRGSRQYTVTIREDGTILEAECSCDTFAGGSYCQHIWAALLDVQYSGTNETTDATAPPAAAEAIARPPRARKRDSSKPRKPVEPEWVKRLNQMRPHRGLIGGDQPVAILPPQRQVCYLIRPDWSISHGGLVIELNQRHPISTGWSMPKRLRINANTVNQLPDADDREICAALIGGLWVDEDLPGDYVSEDKTRYAFQMRDSSKRTMLRRMIATERCFVFDEDRDQWFSLKWDAPGSVPWHVCLYGEMSELELQFITQFRRGDEQLSVDEPALILGGNDGIVIYPRSAKARHFCAAPFDDEGAFRWVTLFKSKWKRHFSAEPISVAVDEIDSFVDRLYSLPDLPEIHLPAEISRTEQRIEPECFMELFSPSADAAKFSSAVKRNQLTARVWFTYDKHKVLPHQTGRFVTDDTEVESSEERTLIRRDVQREKDALRMLASLGFKDSSQFAGSLQLPLKMMPTAVGELIADGWSVTADRHLIRTGGTPRLSVKSGVDWFELHGGIRFETENGFQEIQLPQLLASIKAGRTLITLDDGSQGILPEHWLQSHGLLAAVGEVAEDHLRFKNSQASILDGLLEQQSLVDIDEKFEQARTRLQRFEKIDPVDSDPTFEGTLREYQRDGLGWLRFLRWLDMGGILADDMGLGKTIQVLAMLDRHYNGSEEEKTDTEQKRGPTLIVAPRSVVFNWIDEAARFTPNLKVCSYAGPERSELLETFDDQHMVVTSYGLMRRDIIELKQQQFDFVILDEAQAIKNPGAQAAKAARLLQANQRLALTGTPIENHLGDLWSIFEFLNPGMLGSNTRFADMLRTSAVATNAPRPITPGEEKKKTKKPKETEMADCAMQIGRALKPFILRRTKMEVLDELPEKTEQTLVCQMEPAQRAVYDELLDFYRKSLLNQMDGNSSTMLGKSTMMVLEALLRLRQAACHPGLIDDSKLDLPSAKMDVLLEQLEEVVDEGHKVLVFSQFTSMLSIVRKNLDAHNVTYEYLDGQTRDRKERVDRFQHDPNCPVFLISLKAGGLGLNLTAADYVYLLDPWWNPAVEQQAIDRAHRIGQTRHVFAYRLICENTVEQRILELQDKKRKLADAIVGGQENVLRSLTREDLEMLLS